MPKSSKASKVKQNKSKIKKATANKAQKKIQKKPGPARQALKRACKREILVTQPVLSCDVAKMIKNRKDEATLEKHFKAIKAHKKKYQARVKQAEEKRKKGDASEVHAIPANKAKVTEAIGEHETTIHMLQNYVKDKFGKAYQLVWHFRRRHRNRSALGGRQHAESHLISHRRGQGPGTSLSTNAAKGDQMSKMWVDNTLQQVLNSPNSSADDKTHARNMIRAMAKGPPPEVLGRVVEANPGGGAREVTCPDKGIYHKTK